MKTARISPFTLNSDEAEKSYHTHNVYENEIKAKSTEHILKPAVGSFITVDINSTNPKILNGLYVGQICSIDQNNAEVSFLHKCGKTNKTFYFPEKEDRSWVNFLQIKAVLPEPLFDERRFKYVFVEDIDNVYA